MISNNFLEELTPFQKNLSARMFDLVIGRVLKKTYINLDTKGKENMEKVFLSDNDKAKEDFIKKNIPNFKKVFEEETDKVTEEIEVEILKTNTGA